MSLCSLFFAHHVNTPAADHSSTPGFSLRLHAFLPASRANGPGLRSVIWVQGCTLNCPGCFNPQTHASQGGELWPVQTLAERLLETAPGVEGLTISGGEPLQQAAALVSLLEAIHAANRLSVLLFSGFTLEEIERMPQARAALPYLDILIAGRYDANRRQAHGLLGSSNQKIHLLSSRYSLADLQKVPQAEWIITPQGDILATGIDPR